MVVLYKHERHGEGDKDQLLSPRTRTNEHGNETSRCWVQNSQKKDFCFLDILSYVTPQDVVVTANLY